MKSFFTDPPIRFFVYRCHVAVQWVGFLLLILMVTHAALALQPPAYFQFELTPPAGVPSLQNPAAVFYDHRHGELYIADTGNDRVVIFDRNGNYLFEFSDRTHLQSPRCLAVDSVGHVIALGERKTDRLGVFDYNGAFLREIRLTAPRTDSALAASSFTLDDSDRIYVLTAEPGHIYIFSTEGQRLGDFAIFQEFNKQEDRMQPILPSISYVSGNLIIPMPMISQLAAYDTHGNYVRVFGIAGGGPGLLSFPISAASDGQGGTLVVDKHRHTLLQYDAQGQFVQELGGLGMNRGWFYHPISIASDDSGRCFVLQSFLGRVQAITIPDEKKAVPVKKITAARPDTAAQAAKTP